MVSLRRPPTAEPQRVYTAAQVVGVVTPRGHSDAEFDEIYFEEETPSATVIVAVRLCVWSFFLFGFLMLFQNQQEKFNSARQNGRLRSPQLHQIQVPWLSYSGFRDQSGSFTSHLLLDQEDTFTVRKIGMGDRTVTARRLGMKPLTFDSDEGKSDVYHFEESDDQLVFVTKIADGKYKVETSVASAVEINVGGELIFFHSTENALLGVSRPAARHGGPQVDCLKSFNTTSGACSKATDLLQAQAYFYDPVQSVVVSVGVDDVTEDMNGYSMRGIFVQTTKPLDGSLDMSLTIPFLRRHDEAMWIMQNAPLTDGFIILLPTMGYPSTPVQHMVAIRQGTTEYPKGSVFRLDSESMALWRKVDTLKFNVPLGDSVCSC